MAAKGLQLLGCQPRIFENTLRPLIFLSYFVVYLPCNKSIKRMAKRSKALNDILTTANAVLAQKSVFVGNHYADGRSEEGIAFKQGVINMIETVLHASKSYKGYMYIGPDAIEASCERMYF